MIRRPPSATRTDSLFPDTTLFRSHAGAANFRFNSPLPLSIRSAIMSSVPAPVLGTPLSASAVRVMLLGAGEQIGRAHVELQSLMRISYAVFCLKKKKPKQKYNIPTYLILHKQQNTIIHTHTT